MKIVFASNNRHKLLEVQQLLPGNFELLSLNDIGCYSELAETQVTLEGNAQQKACYVFDHYRVNCFADDTGLEVEALNGAPGVYSARYAGEERNNMKNIEKLLHELKSHNNRKARFRTVICLIIQGKQFLFEGTVNGEILYSSAGKNGFGYDPVFKPEGYNISFAEMNLVEKNKISHRAIAMTKLSEFLSNFPVK